MRWIAQHYLCWGSGWANNLMCFQEYQLKTVQLTTFLKAKSSSIDTCQAELPKNRIQTTVISHLDQFHIAFWQVIPNLLLVPTVDSPYMTHYHVNKNNVTPVLPVTPRLKTYHSLQDPEQWSGSANSEDSLLPILPLTDALSQHWPACWFFFFPQFTKHVSSLAPALVFPLPEMNFSKISDSLALSFH